MIYRIVGRDEGGRDAGLAPRDVSSPRVAGPGAVALAGVELPPNSRTLMPSASQMIVLNWSGWRANVASIRIARKRKSGTSRPSSGPCARTSYPMGRSGRGRRSRGRALSTKSRKGRLKNTRAARSSMPSSTWGKVEVGLAGISTPPRSPPGAAVEALQRAFGSDRYILRNPSGASLVDPSRRSERELSEASDRAGSVSPGPDAAVETARLPSVGSAARPRAVVKSGSVAPLVLTTLAEEARPMPNPRQRTGRRSRKASSSLRDGRGLRSSVSATLNRSSRACRGC